MFIAKLARAVNLHLHLNLRGGCLTRGKDTFTSGPSARIKIKKRREVREGLEEEGKEVEEREREKEKLKKKTKLFFLLTYNL